MAIPILDLFAGPGGLGEGFSSLRRGAERAFQIKLSIEKDYHAHQTLELRAFFRQFDGNAPQDYYEYLRGEITRDRLFGSFPEQAQAAKEEAWHAELGGDQTSDDEVDKRARAALKNPEHWVLIGGPPCQAYSLVGRSKMIGEKGRESYETDHRHFLYRQYLRIIAVHRPSVFVMENVKGLLSAKIQNQSTFKRIIADLQNPVDAGSPDKAIASDASTYRLFSLVVPRTDPSKPLAPKDFVVKAEEYGVPQARHRVILLGVRRDLNLTPRVLERQPSVRIEDVIADLPKLRSGLSKESDGSGEWRSALKSVMDSSWLRGPHLDNHVRAAITDAVEGLQCSGQRGGEFISSDNTPEQPLRDWFHDPRLQGICNHSTRSHIRKDLHRYLFVAAYAEVHGRSPLLEDFPQELLPDHSNVAEALERTKFNDRFRVQACGKPSTTITSHISKDGHYYIHYDPAQCRSLTVREAARLQTFPDNYYFEGRRTQQYHQVGNAVPPLLAKQIAEVVHALLREPL